ncbi:DUF6414 family protein [Luteococcus sp. OSA5]|uniref:DUF6414 family protein n=1 Tax=Luteococcus sp. OSA5 TaxID=3401630 RepID=UPI003B43A786
MSGKKNVPVLATPTVSIYQHPDYVSGILQQLSDGALLTIHRHESGSESTRKKSGDVKGQAKGDGKARVPFFGEATAALDATATAALASNDVSTVKSTIEYTYSQASYLHRVRQVLEERSLLHQITSADDAAALSAGDIVEFEAKFSADKIPAILDMATPAIVRAIVQKQEMDKVTRVIDWTDFEDQQSKTSEARLRIDTQQELWVAVVDAIKSDFRSNDTLEYYGAIGDDGQVTVTAITICDRAHFLVEDHDRILDGRFRVLAKVTAGTAVDRPLLERNKLLDRIQPAAVDALVEEMKQGISKETAATKADGLPTVIQDLGIESRIKGPSFKVMPIAIYV